MCDFRNPLPAWLAYHVCGLCVVLFILGLISAALKIGCPCQPTVAVPLEEPVDYPSVLIHEPVPVR